VQDRPGAGEDSDQAAVNERQGATLCWSGLPSYCQLRHNRDCPRGVLSIGVEENGEKHKPRCCQLSSHDK